MTKRQAYFKEYYARPEVKERKKQQEALYYQQNKERKRQTSIAWKEKNPTKVLASALRRYYNLSIEEYDSLFSKQQGCCAICGGQQTSFTRRFAVDHCHTTGKIRGLLCMKCNTNLGQFELRKEQILKYLEENNGVKACPT